MAVSRFQSDKRKLVIAVSLLLTVGFAAIALSNYYISRGAIRETIAASSLPLTSDNIYSEIQKDLLRPVLISSLMAVSALLCRRGVAVFICSAHLLWGCANGESRCRTAPLNP